MFITLLGRVTDPGGSGQLHLSLSPSDISQGWDGWHSQRMDSFLERFRLETVCTFFTPQSTTLSLAYHHVRSLLSIILILRAGGPCGFTTEFWKILVWQSIKSVGDFWPWKPCERKFPGGLQPWRLQGVINGLSVERGCLQPGTIPPCFWDTVPSSELAMDEVRISGTWWG